MNKHDATEIAYKNGYKQGKIDTVRKMRERLTANSFKHKNLGELVYVEDINRIAKETQEGTP